MLVGLVLMLGIFIVSIVVAMRVAAHAVTLTTQQRTRFRGVSILMAGAAGIILTNLLVYVVRIAPSILDPAPTFIQLITFPFVWAVIMPVRAFAYTASTIFGFAWAAGLASVFVAVVMAIRRGAIGGSP